MTNIVLIVGNLGTDPVTRSTGNREVTTISVATTRRWNAKEGEKREETKWHRVTCFNGLAKNVANYTREGAKVSVQGRLHYSKWQTQDGTDEYGVEILADEVSFLDRAKSDGETSNPVTTDPAGSPTRRVMRAHLMLIRWRRSGASSPLRPPAAAAEIELVEAQCVQRSDARGVWINFGRSTLAE